MVGHGGSSARSHLADPTSPIPSHCASIVVTSTLRIYTIEIGRHGKVKNAFGIIKTGFNFGQLTETPDSNKRGQKFGTSENGQLGEVVNIQRWPT